MVWLLFLFLFFFILFLRLYLPNLSKLFKLRLSLLTATPSLLSHDQPLSQLRSIFKQLVVFLTAVVLTLQQFESFQLVKYQLTGLYKVTSIFFSSGAKHTIKLHLYRKLLS